MTILITPGNKTENDRKVGEKMHLSPAPPTPLTCPLLLPHVYFSNDTILHPHIRQSREPPPTGCLRCLLCGDYATCCSNPTQIGAKHCQHIV